MYARTLAWSLIFRSSKLEGDTILSLKTLGMHKQCSQNLFFFKEHLKTSFSHPQYQSYTTKNAAVDDL